ncbi:MAG: glycoside hydrolase family 3 C-terminal domain-containing protein, partial [Propionibacteriaceae bacterium]|nr:glycoside hydrolase family 3 C-terminal domain-containing protein [Propionibacteriaceae bacterium]
MSEQNPTGGQAGVQVAPSARVAALVAEMTTAEKMAQLQGIWLSFAESAVVAPEMDTQGGDHLELAAVAADGLGQLTRIFGTKPVSPRQGIATLLNHQRWVAANTKRRIGLLAHEECLSGLAAWTATTFPTPLASAAAFDQTLMRAMGEAIGATMAQIGVHQGLAPVLDVVRDARWGRVEETMGEDPYVVATLGRAYIEGIQSQGVLTCAKHFAGYSNSAAGRNLAPVHMGRRELDDVFLPPFEVAVRDAGVASIMPAYVEIDGVPLHAAEHLLTDLIRDQWSFAGTVLADYFGVAFLFRQHGVAASLAQAGALALTAGVDVELPSGDAFRDPALLDAIDADDSLRQVVDRAVTRVLTQKEALGLLDIDTEIARLEALLSKAPETLDVPEHREIAAQLAQKSVILLNNDGVLPLADRDGLKLAVIGPNGDRMAALFGCYSFVNHVLMNNPGYEPMFEAATVAQSVRKEFPQADVVVAQGCDVRGDDASAIDDAVAAAQSCDITILVVGDQAGLFGRGTSGEGCDADSLELPGVQPQLVDAILATGKPVVLVAVTGRPYAIGGYAQKAAATLQVFFPGEEGGAAIAGVLSG